MRFKLLHEEVLPVNEHNHVGQSELKGASDAVLHLVLAYDQILVAVPIVLI